MSDNKELNEDDSRMVEQFELSIRNLYAQQRITKAKLIAEVTNSELIVFIGQDINAKDDKADLQTKIDGLQA